MTAGIAGAGRRGGSFKAGLDAAGIQVRAVCDVDAADLADTAARMGARQQYRDYEQMLDRSGVDAVIIATPMQLHVPMAIAALERDIHVLSEVPAGVSLAECRALVRACRASRAAYMMAENCVYLRNNMGCDPRLWRPQEETSQSMAQWLRLGGQTWIRNWWLISLTTSSWPAAPSALPAAPLGC